MPNSKKEFRIFLPLAKNISHGVNQVTKKRLSKEIGGSITSSRLYKAEVHSPENFVDDPKTDKQVPQFSDKYIEGIASGVEMDLYEERMAKSALISMMKCLDKGVVLREGHDQDYTGLNGKVLELKLTKDENGIDSLYYKAVLNNPAVDPAAAKLLFALNSGTILGVSIGGYIQKYHFEKTEGEDILVIDEVLLEEITTTCFPAYTLSTASLIKTLKSFFMKKPEDNEQSAISLSSDPKDENKENPKEELTENADAQGTEKTSDDVQPTSSAENDDIQQQEDSPTETTSQEETSNSSDEEASDAPAEKEETNADEAKSSGSEEETTPSEKKSETKKGDVSEALSESESIKKSYLYEPIMDIIFMGYDIFCWSCEKKSEDFPVIKSEIIELIQNLPNDIDSLFVARETNKSLFEKAKLLKGGFNVDKLASIKKYLESQQENKEVSKSKPDEDQKIGEVIATALKKNDEKWNAKMQEFSKKIAELEEQPSGRQTAIVVDKAAEGSSAKNDSIGDKEVQKHEGKTYEEWIDHIDKKIAPFEKGQWKMKIKEIFKK